MRPVRDNPYGSRLSPECRWLAENAGPAVDTGWRWQLRVLVNQYRQLGFDGWMALRPLWLTWPYMLWRLARKGPFG